MDPKLLESLSNRISPDELKTKEFKKVMMGYSPEEVVAFLDQTAKTWIQVQKRERDLIQKIELLNTEISQWKKREEEIVKIKQDAIQEAQQIRELGAKDAEKLLRQVEEKAQDIRVKTEEWLAEVINKVQETERQKNNFMTAFKSALDSHYDLIKNDQELAEPLTHQLDSFLKTVMQSSGTH